MARAAAMTQGSGPSISERATAVIAFGPYRLFASLRRLERAGRAVELGSRAFDILCVLLEHAGEIVTNREADGARLGQGSGGGREPTLSSR
jgi:DNA-binding response OmpR family regulator